MSALDPELEALLGTTVAGKYRLDALIGRGGMGAVFQATNIAIGKRVALKFLYRDAARDHDAVTRFQREAEAASAVESAHIVEIFDSGTTEEGLPFLVMELLKGEDLRARLRRDERVSFREATYIGGQVARALRRAHEAGIIHRDLKPDNVFLCHRDDDPMFVKLVDFGISKVTRKAPGLDTLTRKGLVLGTAFYMSPEQAQAKADVDGRTDIFSLGAILFETLTGRPPHVGQAYEAVLIAICTKDAPDVRELAPDVPEALARVVTRALERDRDARFQTAGELYDALAIAVPGLLNTGGQISEPVIPFESSRARGVIPRPRGTETDESAAVNPPPPAAPGHQLRRTVVTAVVAALAAFALTVIVMARRAPPDPVDATAAPAVAPPHDPVPQSSVVHESASASPSRHRAMAAISASPVAASAAASVSAAPSSTRANTTRPPAPKPVRPRSTRPSTSNTKSTVGGVAKGLQLATEP